MATKEENTTPRVKRKVMCVLTSCLLHYMEFDFGIGLFGKTVCDMIITMLIQTLLFGMNLLIGSWHFCATPRSWKCRAFAKTDLIDESFFKEFDYATAPTCAPGMELS